MIDAAPASRRAAPLAPDARREMILDITIPLLIEQGSTVTTKLIAERAGIAEGTLFRVFGDKESLVAAAVERFLDPELLRANLRTIDRGLPLEARLADILFHMRARFTGIFGIMAAVGHSQRSHDQRVRPDFSADIAAVLEPELSQLHWTPEQVTSILRLVAFAASMPQLNDGHELSTPQLASLLLHGIAGTPAEGH